MQNKTAPSATSVPIYEVGVQELHRVSQDDTIRRAIDHDFNEARGREGARLHVTLKALTEVEKRNVENVTAALQAIDQVAGELASRTAALAEMLRNMETGQAKRLESAVANVQGLAQQIHDARTALWNQAEGSLQSLSSQQQESTERIAVDIRKLRDEVVSLMDSRMNQADASFAALRGDVEVVKYLVMDLIKDRIGRNEPKGKTY